MPANSLKIKRQALTKESFIELGSQVAATEFLKNMITVLMTDTEAQARYLELMRAKKPLRTAYFDAFTLMLKNAGYPSRSLREYRSLLVKVHAVFGDKLNPAVRVFAAKNLKPRGQNLTPA